MKDTRFIRLVGAYFISSIGDWLYKIALPLLVYDLTGSAIQMAGAFSLTFLPYIFVSLVGGVIADRFNRKKVLIMCDFIAFLALGAIAVLANEPSLLLVIYLLVFIASSLTPIHHPSFQAFIPEVVERDELARTNAFISGSENLIVIGAPLIGGAFVALLGAKMAIAFNAVTFLLSALLIYTIKSKPLNKEPAEAVPFIDDVKEGFRLTWSHPVLKYGALVFFGTNFAINIFQANLIFFLTGVLSASADRVGVSFALIGVGALLGATIAPYVIKRFESGQIIVTTTILAGVLTFPLLWAENAIQVGMIWALESFFSSINMITYFTLRQKAVPSHMLGRAVAITRLIAYSSIPIAGLLGGFLVEKSGIFVVIIICGSVRMLAGIFAYFTPLSSYKTEKEATAPISAH